MLTNTTFVKNGVNKDKLIITGMVLRICLLKGPISYLHATPSLEPETHQEHGQWTARITVTHSATRQPCSKQLNLQRMHTSFRVFFPQNVIPFPCSTGTWASQFLSLIQLPIIHYNLVVATNI